MTRKEFLRFVCVTVLPQSGFKFHSGDMVVMEPLTHFHKLEMVSEEYKKVIQDPAKFAEILLNQGTLAKAGTGVSDTGAGLPVMGVERLPDWEQHLAKHGAHKPFRQVGQCR